LYIQLSKYGVFLISIGLYDTCLHLITLVTNTYIFHSRSEDSKSTELD